MSDTPRTKQIMAFVRKLNDTTLSTEYALANRDAVHAAIEQLERDLAAREAELARVKAEQVRWSEGVHAIAQGQIIAAVRECAEWRAKAEANERDGARYRLIRDHDWNDERLSQVLFSESVSDWDRMLDEIIDAHAGSQDHRGEIEGEAMTLQERLRQWKGSTMTVAIAAQEAADALDAQDKRIKELEGALRELSAMYTHAWDTTDGSLLMLSESIPRFEAAHKKADEVLHRAREALEGK